MHLSFCLFYFALLNVKLRGTDGNWFGISLFIQKVICEFVFLMIR